MLSAAFRVELYACYAVSLNGRAILDFFVICQGQDITGMFGFSGEGMYEVHPCGIVQSAVDLCLRAGVIESDLIPADGGNSADAAVFFDFRQFSNDPGYESESLVESEFFAGVEQELHTEADTEQWFSGSGGFLERLQQLELSEGLHGVPEGSYAGQNDAVGLQQCVGLSGDLCIDSAVEAGVSDAEEVSETVIDDLYIGCVHVASSIRQTAPFSSSVCLSCPMVHGRTCETERPLWRNSRFPSLALPLRDGIERTAS